MLFLPTLKPFLGGFKSVWLARWAVWLAFCIIISLLTAVFLIWTKLSHYDNKNPSSGYFLLTSFSCLVRLGRIPSSDVVLLCLSVGSRAVTFKFQSFGWRSFDPGWWSMSCRGPEVRHSLLRFYFLPPLLYDFVTIHTEPVQAIENKRRSGQISRQIVFHYVFFSF